MCQVLVQKLGQTQYKLNKLVIQHVQCGSYSQYSTFEINMPTIEECILKGKKDSEREEEHRGLPLAFHLTFSSQ